MAEDVWAELQASTRAADAAFAAVLGRGGRGGGKSTPRGDGTPTAAGAAAAARAKAVAASILSSGTGDAVGDLTGVTHLLRVSRVEAADDGSGGVPNRAAAQAEHLVRAAAAAQASMLQSNSAASYEAQQDGTNADAAAVAVWTQPASASPEAILASLTRATNTLGDASSQPVARVAAVTAMHSGLTCLVARVQEALGDAAASAAPGTSAGSDEASASGSLFFEAASRAVLDPSEAQALASLTILVFPPVTVPALRRGCSNSGSANAEAWAWDGLTPLPLVPPQQQSAATSNDIEDKTDDDADAQEAAADPVSTALGVLQKAWGQVAKPLSGALDDAAEAVRLAAVQAICAVLPWLPSLAGSVPYFLPRLAARTASTWVLDTEQKVFATSLEALDAYRRGRVVATSQGIIAGGDASATSAVTAAATPISAATAHSRVAEPSEAVRARLAAALTTLLVCGAEGGYMPLLGTYLQDVVLGLHALAVDPDPEVRLRGCYGLVTLTRTVPPLIKYFAVALVRSLAVAGLDHRYARVRLATLAAVEALVSCLDDAKGRGAGSEALLHLMGQREANVVSVSSFYGADTTTINYCAKLASDTNP